MVVTILKMCLALIGSVHLWLNTDAFISGHAWNSRSRRNYGSARTKRNAGRQWLQRVPWTVRRRCELKCCYKLLTLHHFNEGVALLLFS